MWKHGGLIIIRPPTRKSWGGDKAPQSPLFPLNGESIEVANDPSGGSDRAWVDLDPGSHGRRYGDPLDVGALDAGRLGLGDRIDEGTDILEELALAERDLADAGMDDAGLLGPKLDGAPFGRLHRR